MNTTLYSMDSGRVWSEYQTDADYVGITVPTPVTPTTISTELNGGGTSVSAATGLTSSTPETPVILCLDGSQVSTGVEGEDPSVDSR